VTVDEMVRSFDPSRVGKVVGEAVFGWSRVGVPPWEAWDGSIVLRAPFRLDFVLVDSLRGDDDGLEGLRVVDLLSGGRSLFVTPGSFPASVFSPRGRGPTFGSMVTQVGEPLVLRVANESETVKVFSAAVLATFFPTGSSRDELAEYFNSGKWPESWPRE
jgi:hypothetical protein